LAVDWTRVQAALFDIDGTLIDSNPAHSRAWTQALREHGVDVDETDVRAQIGKGGDKLLPTLAGVEEDSPRGRRIATRKAEIFRGLLPGLRATRGARELLDFLRQRDIRLGIATSASDEEVDALLKQARLDDLIRAGASKDDAGQSKPEPDIVQASLAKLGSAADAAVLIGDTPYDVQSAEAAGVPSVALRCGGFWSDAALGDARAIFDDPAALLAALLNGQSHAHAS